MLVTRMHDPHEFLRALTVVLCVAAVTTVIFQRLRQPVILGYILAGLIVGPHVPLPLVADSEVVRTLSEIGVILLMFSLGLEFSLLKLIQVGPTAALTALVETSLMMWLGFSVAQLFGWTVMEGMFTGAIVAISSTTIVAKAFQEQKVTGKLREIVVGVLIVEDLIAILLMTTLTAIASGSGLSPGPLAWTIGRLAAFLIGLVVVGLFIVPRAIRLINRLNRPETTIVASVGLCFALALLAQWFGYSIALGAFIAGSLVAESGEEKPIERLVEPVRDIFAAVFFVSVGMLIDPVLIARYWPEILVLTTVVVLGKIFGVSLGSFLTGNRLRTSVQSGMSLAQIGEFSFIIAGLGLTLNATQSFLYPVAIVISALTTLTTPWLIRASGPTASWIDRKLPRPLQTFTVLYGSWVESLRNTPRSQTTMARIRRMLRSLLVDTTLCAGIVIGILSSRGKLARLLQEQLGTPEPWIDPILIGAAVLLAGPFFLGMIRVGRKLGLVLAEVVLPAAAENRVDLAAAPRRLLVATFELAIVVILGAPLVAITRPLLPGAPVRRADRPAARPSRHQLLARGDQSAGACARRCRSYRRCPGQAVAWTRRQTRAGADRGTAARPRHAHCHQTRNAIPRRRPHLGRTQSARPDRRLSARHHPRGGACYEPFGKGSTAGRRYSRPHRHARRDCRGTQVAEVVQGAMGRLILFCSRRIDRLGAERSATFQRRKRA